MPTSVVSSSRSVGRGRLSVGAIDATRTGAVRGVRCGCGGAIAAGVCPATATGR